MELKYLKINPLSYGGVLWEKLKYIRARQRNVIRSKIKKAFLLLRGLFFLTIYCGYGIKD
jgi:hypothetical protein